MINWFLHILIYFLLDEINYLVLVSQVSYFILYFPIFEYDFV